MYSREYGGEELLFEASGGLMNSSLVMQDKQTDSYWAIMRGESVGGAFLGTKLVELPTGSKVSWRDWRRRHPDTLVLSIQGRQYTADVYTDYWARQDGFGGQLADDRRLDTKTPIYAFEADGERYAVTHDRIHGGAAFALPSGRAVFLFRQPDSLLFASTAAFSGDGFVDDEGVWRHVTGESFDPQLMEFDGEIGRLGGFDTFWYTWSLNNPETRLLE